MDLAQLAGSVPVNVVQINSGYAGTVETAQKMIEVIQASMGDQLVRMTAEELLVGTPAYDREGEIEAIYQYVRDKVRYTKDPAGLEYVQTPKHLIQMIMQRGQAYGDCDDKTVLGLAMLKNLGYEVAIRVAGYKTPGVYTHVYGLVKVKHNWIVFDATPADEELGWEHPFVDVKDFPVSAYGRTINELSGMGIDTSQMMTTAFAIAIGGAITVYIQKYLK